MMTLQQLSSAAWTEIWVQGGELEPRSGMVFEGDMVIETDKGTFQLGAFAMTDEERIEHYQLYAEAIDEVGSVVSEQGFFPPRKIVESFPPVLAVDKFLGGGPSKSEALIDKDDGKELLVGVMFGNGTARLLFFADDDVPESLIVTSDEAEIARRIAGLEVRRILPTAI